MANKRRFDVEVRLLLTEEQKSVLNEYANKLGLKETDVLRMLITQLKEKGTDIFS